MEPFDRAIAIVGVGAILPDSPNVAAFWKNIKEGRYSISDVSAERWDPALYYDPDPAAADKTYSKIGGWVREYGWEPMKWHLPLPPKVTAAMDEAQRWAIACTREALEDYGYPKRQLDVDRTGVILGNAMAGERHYLTAVRVAFPEYARDLEQTKSFAALPEQVRSDIARQLHERIANRLPEITEDSMPGELANCIAGRIANLYNFHGPNYVVDAACASAMAAMSSAAEGLIEKDFDVAITGGIDRNMGASTFVKFCKIGALSATGTRPYAEGADGFVMGEGAVIFVMKRLGDAEHDGDSIYAVLRGMGASSDGKGKGITAPNPIGQKFCVERAWKNAGLPPSIASYIEGHGTSTRVGDVVEVQSIGDVLSASAVPNGSVAIGSVKSNIGHLKGAAGAAGMLKTTLALHHKELPPSVHCEHKNPDIDFAHSPLYVNTELRPWNINGKGIRCAGVSAFGFGGTNFHAVLEEYIPGRLKPNGKRSIAVPENFSGDSKVVGNASGTDGSRPSALKAPLRGALVVGADSTSSLINRLRNIQREAEADRVPAVAAPLSSDLRAPERVAIDYSNTADLADKAAKTVKALEVNQVPVWKALRAQGIFRGSGPAPKIAFLYTGQGSQYVNMLRTLRASEPIVAETFAEADGVLAPLVGKPLTEFIYVDQANDRAVAKAEDDLRQTAITQPAVLASDIGITRLLAAYGIHPDMTMGHSLGEYGALVASGSLGFAEALEGVSARGREMTRVSVKDNGKMAAVFAPLTQIESILKTIDGYVVIANINSEQQSVIGGSSEAVERASEKLLAAGFNVVPLPVSHAFHTSIVAPASEPLREMLQRLHLQPPCVPIVANVNGEFYPTGPDAVPKMLDILANQIASPVQFVKGLHTLYNAGARVFVEVGPKKALQGFAEDVLGSKGDVLSLFTNHPKFDDLAAFNQALCGMYAAGLGCASDDVVVAATSESSQKVPSTLAERSEPAPKERRVENMTLHAPSSNNAVSTNGDRYTQLGHLFADFLERGWEVYRGAASAKPQAPVVITGAALGLPGTEHIFDDNNIARLLHGEQFIDVIPTRLRRDILDKHITRLVKSDNGGPTFETIHDIGEVIKLAGRAGEFDLEREFGVPAERVAALDRVTRLAIGVGIDALRDAGIPLILRYKTTSKGTQLPDRWALPPEMQDDTGVIFASAFPAIDTWAREMGRYYADHHRREQLSQLQELRARIAINGHAYVAEEIDRRIAELQEAIERDPYVFDRRFLFHVLSMGHSQFAEYIGARGPNTQVNAACASTTQAIAIAEDWIHSGRCRRVVVISADDITTDNVIGWFGAGFLASGVAATDEVVENAALPFDRRRHGMIIGMGAAAVVVEDAASAHERGIQPICEVLGAVTANSAFHGTRLDVHHIGQVMEELLKRAENVSGIQRQQIAPQTVFVSHETYTPARGGSASAEIFALRKVFGDAADQVVIANTKGFTGHAMGAGVEDVLAVKSLETGVVPPVANFRDIDPELGALNLSKGGSYPVEYALRLGAGFGSQISMTLLRRTQPKGVARPPVNALGFHYRADEQTWNKWLQQATGSPNPELEVVHRTLRVRDHSMPTQVPATTSQSMPVSLNRPSAPMPAPALTEVTVAPAPVRAPEMKATEPPQPNATPGDAIPATPTDPVKERILALVVEKTGYPPDMLALDLDLEADLGVDTVKQAEMFAAIREIYNIPRDENRRLRDYPTLAHVIRFVYEQRPDLAATQSAAATEEQQQSEPASTATPEVKPPTTEVLAGDPVKERILALVVEKTGYPQDMLDLDLDLEADLGVDTVKQAEMFAAIREIYQIPRDENRKLRDYPTLAHVIHFVYEKRPDLTATPITSTQPVITGPETTATMSANQDEITDKILSIVAEKTGYPKDMLDLDLDLEADLGIDTVKQAEMFAAVRGAYNIPRDETLKLRDFPTLQHVIQFARDRSAKTAAPPEITPEKTAVHVAPAAPTPHIVRSSISFDAANRIPRRIPVPILRPPLGLCKSTDVALGTGSRVIVMPDQGGAGTELIKRLQSRSVEVLMLEPSSDSDTVLQHIKEWVSAGPVTGVFWLPALDVEQPVSSLDLNSWREALRTRVTSLYTTMRAVFEQMSAPGSFLTTAVRLGGQHGYDPQGATSPMGGAVTGFTKAFKRERPAASVKAVDFELELSSDRIAELLIEETMRDPGAVEVGYKNGLRWSVGLQEQPVADGQPDLSLTQDTVFVVTGAAGSIVSAITADLAAASGGIFYLLDLVPKPDPANPDIKRFSTDKDGLKRDLAARLKAAGERVTPAMVEKELAALERAQAAQAAIDAVSAAGGTAYYCSVNLTDSEAVARVINKIREEHGRVDVLLHAAGQERSHFIPDKDPREFELVFGVKTDGWFNLLKAIGDMPLGATIAFSSIAGRFGNGGQTDYSAANDLLCKFASSFRSTRPQTRAIAIDWTAWAGIGMASRGSIPKVMEAAGIDMLPPEAGVPVIRRELTSGTTSSEIVIGNKLGVLMEEFDATGGLDLQALESYREKLPARGPMTGKITGMGIYRGLTMETTLAPASQPFLNDHRIDGTPVLPGVMGIEAFAEAALCLHPGWRIATIEQVDFLTPFKFYKDEPRTVVIEAQFYPEGEKLLAACRLIGHRVLPGQQQPQETLHFASRVLVTKQSSEKVSGAPPQLTAESIVEAAQIYRIYFHGPAYQVLERAWWDGKHVVGEMSAHLPIDHQPSDQPTAIAPRLIELCLQTAGVWEIGTKNRLGLPTHIEHVSWLSQPQTGGGRLYAFVTPHSEDGTFDAEVVDSSGKKYVTMQGYRTAALPAPIDVEAQKKLHQIVTLEAVA